MVSKIVLVAGILGLLLGVGTVIVCFVLVATSNGRTSMEEALPGIIGGGCCSIVSMVLAVVGVVLLLGSRKKTPPGTPPEQPKA